MINIENYHRIIEELGNKVTLVAVSKTKPVEDIKALYDLGQRDFGENYVQELTGKAEQLPNDIRWHFIGHLQSNKVKYIAPFIHLIHGVESWKLLLEIDKQAGRNHRIIDCLLQVYIAQEETKFGLDEKELNAVINQVDNVKMTNARVRGLMGMASFTDDMNKVRSEFKYLKNLLNKYAEAPTTFPRLQILSMGMSADYRVAVEEGSTMVRIGSLLFGARS